MKNKLIIKINETLHTLDVWQLKAVYAALNNVCKEENHAGKRLFGRNHKNLEKRQSKLFRN